MNRLSFFVTGQMDGASMLRGKQMAEYLGAKFNPTSNYEDDICIFVKKPPFDNWPEKSYYDVVDYRKAGRWLQEHESMKIITAAECAKQYFSKALNRSDLILIPHHHCNFERSKNNIKQIINAGTVGNEKMEYYDVEEIKDRLKKIGINFSIYTDYKNRQDVVNFYKGLDIQIIPRRKLRRYVYQTPLKIVNAASFGIPTFSWPEMSYCYEWDNEFIKFKDVNRLIEAVCILKDNMRHFEQISDRVFSLAESYHIDNISKKYLELE